MNFDFTDEEKNFFSEVTKAMEAAAENRDFESGDLDTVRENLAEALTALAPTGYLKLGLNAKGAPVSGTLPLMAAMEQLSGISPSLFLAVEMSTRMFGRVVALGQEAGKGADILSALVDGKTVGAVALSEESINVENDPLTTTATREGDVVRVSGTKSLVINGPLADWFAVVGMLDEKAAVFLIEKDAPGLTLTDRQSTMGYDGVAISGLELDGCRVPEDRILGPFDNGFFLEQLKLWENQILIASSLGLMQASYETARDYAKQHRSGGKPIIAYQEVGFKLSEMLTLYQTAQLYAYRAAWMAEDNPKEAGLLTLCAKVFCTESAEVVAGKSLQVQSKDGYLAGGKAERSYRCAKYGQIAGVSTEIARVKIGDAALGRF
jgi:alkylation response protein AidB-like acyl-CoA dehydrogenase